MLSNSRKEQSFGLSNIDIFSSTTWRQSHRLYEPRKYVEGKSCDRAFVIYSGEVL